MHPRPPPSPAAAPAACARAPALSVSHRNELSRANPRPARVALTMRQIVPEEKKACGAGRCRCPFRALIQL